MTTLAHQYLTSHQVHLNGNINLDAMKNWTHEFVRSRLATTKESAERYVFEDDPTRIVGTLVKNNSLSQKSIMETAKLPASSLWIEFPLEQEPGMKIGFAIGYVKMNETFLSETRIAIAFVAGIDGKGAAAFALITLPETDSINGKSRIDLHWYRNSMARKDFNGIEEMQVVLQYHMDLLDCLFLINTPRVCEVRAGGFGPRKKKVQERTGKTFIELKMMKVLVGIGSPRYERGPNQDVNEGIRHKLHRVIGHFRTYREGRTAPKISFVPEHWRGDAHLGMVLHERKVIVPPTLTPIQK